MNFADVPARRKVPVLFLSPAIQSFLGYRVIIYGSELIAVAISVAYLYSSAVIFGLEGKYFWELATLIDIMLLGH